MNSLIREHREDSTLLKEEIGKVPFANKVTYALKEITMNNDKDDILITKDSVVLAILHLLKRSNGITFTAGSHLCKV